MAEGSYTSKGVQKPYEQVWETLQFRTSDEKYFYTNNVSKEIDICKLQFVLQTDIAKRDFLARLTEKVAFEVISPGIVNVEYDSFRWNTIGHFWASLIKSVHSALESKSVSSVKFATREHFEKTLQQIGDRCSLLLSRGLVGVFISYEENTCIANCVGDERDVKELTSSLRSMYDHLSQGKPANAEESRPENTVREVSPSRDRITFDFERVWETLQFRVSYGKENYKKRVSKEFDICKLQFVLQSDTAKVDFLARLTEKFAFEVISSGIVNVEYDSSRWKSIEHFWTVLFESVHSALESKSVSSVTFATREHFEKTLQQIDESCSLLLSRGLVGVFISNKENTCIANCVGDERDVKEFTISLQSMYDHLSQGKSANAEESRLENTVREVSPSRDQIPYENVWKTLKLRVSDGKHYYEKHVSKESDICKLQFVLQSEIAKTEFLTRLRQKFAFTVISQGIVDVEYESSKWKSIDQFWTVLFKSVQLALKKKVVRSVTFATRQELNKTIKELDEGCLHLLSSGLVGVFISYEEYTCVAKCVGDEDDLEEFTIGLQSMNDHLSQGKSVNSEESRPQPIVGKQQLLCKKITVEEEVILEVMKFKEFLHEKCPHVKYKDMKNENGEHEISSSDEKEFQVAVEFINTHLDVNHRDNLSLPPRDLQFLNQENVRVYLQVQLKKVPAYLQISFESSYIWAKDRSKLEEAKNVVLKSYKSETLTIEGYVSQEAQTILHESHEKIQIVIVTENPYVKTIHVHYTTDKEISANKLVEILRNCSYRRQKSFDKDQIEAMLALGIVKDLQGGFQDVSIQVDDEESVVSLQSSALDRINACFADLEVNIRHIEYINIKFLPDAAQKLLQSGRVCRNVQDMIKEEKIAFLLDGSGKPYLVCRNGKNVQPICISIKNCFVEMYIDSECLENARGKTFLEKHSEEVFVQRNDSKNETYLCFTSNLSKEIEDILCDVSKHCSVCLNDYLSHYGSSFLKQIEEKHSVEVELRNGRITFKGSYHKGKEALAELESHVETVVLHFGPLEKEVLELQPKRKVQVGYIAEKCKCGLKDVEFPYDQQASKENEGINNLCTWKLHHGKGTISVAEIDYNTAKLDAFIIPVNECLFGENFQIGEEEEILYAGNLNGPKLAIGDWSLLHTNRKYACSKCIGLVISNTGIVDNKQSCRYASTNEIQKYTADVAQDLFRQELFRIAFAIPGKSPDFYDKVSAIVAGVKEVMLSLDGSCEPMFLFGIKSEAELWIPKVDDSLKKTTCTKRNVSPRYNGLLHRPKINTQITAQSILDVGASCLVVAVSRDLDLSKGFVSNLVSEACGPKLQKELYSSHQKSLGNFDLTVFNSYDLSYKGVKKLIFGFLPAWSSCNRSTLGLETFIQESLLLADNAGCPTVAFPALGTGNLKYPLRDVAEAMFYGINKYISEAMIGQISTVYITVPSKDDEMYKILEKEQKSREEQDAEKQAKLDDERILFADDVNVKYTIVNENLCERMRSGAFVNVVFTPDKTTSDVTPRLEESKMVVKCKDSKDGLKDAVEHVVCLCENNKITSVNVFCSKGFSDISEADQTDIITELVYQTVYNFPVDKYPSRNYKYLKNVHVVTSYTAFLTIYELKMSGKTKSKSFGSTVKSLLSITDNEFPLQWKRDCYRTSIPPKYLNVILCGGEGSDLKKANCEIRKLLATKEIQTKVVKQEDVTQIDDQVSAELNPGIVKYLHSLPESDLRQWNKELRDEFQVLLRTYDSNSKIELCGSFDNILRIEQYLEKDFPAFPSEKEAGLKFYEEHFHNQEQATQSISVSEKDMSCHPSSISKEMQSEAQKSILRQPKGTKKSDKAISKDTFFVQKAKPETTNLQQRKKTLYREEFKKAIYRFRNLVVNVKCCDITEIKSDCIVSAVNEVINTSVGVAKSIANKAGKNYQKVCKAFKGPLGITDCFATESGNLKCNHVIHVHSPLQFEASQEQLIQLFESVTRCLETADQLEANTVAIPFLCAGASGFPVDLCAQQYFRALRGFNNAKYLQEVILVDIDKKKVSDVCCMLTKCIGISDEDINQLYAELTVETSASNIMYYIVSGEMHSVSCDAVVVGVTEKFIGQDDALDRLLACATQGFRDAYEEKKIKLSHPTSSVTTITSGGLPCRYVLFAVFPALENDHENYVERMQTTVRNIFEEANRFKISNLVLPIFGVEENHETLKCYCQAMVESCLQIGQHKNHVNLIQFLSLKQKAISMMCQEMVHQLKHDA